jgi:hypothetical protein
LALCQLGRTFCAAQCSGQGLTLSSHYTWYCCSCVYFADEELQKPRRAYAKPHYYTSTTSFAAAVGKEQQTLRWFEDALTYASTVNSEREDGAGCVSLTCQWTTPVTMSSLYCARSPDKRPS